MESTSEIVTSVAGARAVIVLTTLAADADAAAFASALVEERLAACVNVLPVMASIYRWKGRIERDAEQQVVIKTSARRVPALEARLRELHPYALPEFLVIRVAGGSAAYLRWLGESTAAPRSATRRPGGGSAAVRTRE